MVDLRTKYLGIQLKNPLIIGSSGLTDDLSKIKELENSGAGALILKSLFEEEIIYEMEQSMHKMNSRSMIFPETYDYMDDFFEEDSLRKYLRLIEEAKSGISIPVIASINCKSAQKWTYFAKEIEKAGADALELNMFILPSDIDKSGVDNEKLYFEIVKKVLSEIKIPVALKISYYFSSLAGLIKDLSNTEVKGIVLFNRYYSPDIDLDTLKITSSAIMSASKDYIQSLRWIAIMSNRINCDICASTGIHDAETGIKQILAGADAFQMVSAIYKKGPAYIKDTLKNIENWMQKMEFKSINEFKGKLSQKNSIDPAEYARTQFMKNYREFVN